MTSEFFNLSGTPIFRKTVLFIFLTLFSGCFVISLFLLQRKITKDEIIQDLEKQNKNLNEKYTESRNVNDVVMTSGFGTIEYYCTGSCYCQVREEEETYTFRRRVGAVLNTRLSTFIFAVSSFLAYKLAQKQFDVECEEVMKNEENCDSYHHIIQSEVEECADEFKDQSSINEEELEDDDDENVCSVTDAIFGRRSIRDYLDTPIPSETVKDIIEIGNFAPSARNQQSLRYYIIENHDLLQDISDVCTNIHYGEVKDRNIFYNAPVVIFITVNDGIKGYDDLDTGVAMQNMQLYAYSKGIGSCCIGFAKYCTEYAEEVLGIEEGEKFACAMVFGFPNPETNVVTPKRKDAWIKTVEV